jgi:hypothetical protein
MPGTFRCTDVTKERNPRSINAVREWLKLKELPRIERRYDTKLASLHGAAV